MRPKSPIWPISLVTAFSLIAFDSSHAADPTCEGGSCAAPEASESAGILLEEWYGGSEVPAMPT